MGTYDFAVDNTAQELAERALASTEGGAIELTDRELRVTMGNPPIFSTTIHRQSIRSASRVSDLTKPTRGAHGFRGRWLVNRAGTNLVKLEIRPPANATLSPPSMLKDPGRLLKFITRKRSIRLKELTLSADSPTV